MNRIQNGVVCALFSSILLCSAITVQEVQTLDKNSFFSGWSKFLDKVLQAKEESFSDEDKNIYNAFMQQAKKLNIAKVTGNRNAISDMKKQMDLIHKRMSDEKQLLSDWAQLQEVLTQSTQYPLSVENEEAYATLVRRGKDLGVDKSSMQEMQKKMDEIRATLKGTVMPVAEPVQEPVKESVVEPVVKEPLKEENATGTEGPTEKPIVEVPK